MLLLRQYLALAERIIAFVFSSCGVWSYKPCLPAPGAYALFTQEVMLRVENRGSFPSKLASKRCSEAWSGMAESEKALWRTRAQERKKKQTEAYVELQGDARNRVSPPAGDDALPPVLVPSVPNGAVFGVYVVVSDPAACLGFGSYGKVVVARHTALGHRVAVKVYFGNDAELAQREFDVYEDLKALSGWDGPALAALAVGTKSPTFSWLAVTLFGHGAAFP
jgi:hypothetical protein